MLNSRRKYVSNVVLKSQMENNHNNEFGDAVNEDENGNGRQQQEEELARNYHEATKRCRNIAIAKAKQDAAEAAASVLF